MQGLFSYEVRKGVVMALVKFWCLKCERVFQVDLPDKLEPVAPGECQFDRCDCADIWLWWKLEEINKRYPKIPYAGVTYPLYPTEKDYQRIKAVHEFLRSL